jgi:hypothetical protein
MWASTRTRTSVSDQGTRVTSQSWWWPRRPQQGITDSAFGLISRNPGIESHRTLARRPREKNGRKVRIPVVPPPRVVHGNCYCSMAQKRMLEDHEQFERHGWCGLANRPKQALHPALSHSKVRHPRLFPIAPLMGLCNGLDYAQHSQIV